MVIDFIFAGRLTKGDDDAFIRETRAANNVYFEMAFELRESNQESRKQPIDEKNFIFRQCRCR